MKFLLKLNHYIGKAEAFIIAINILFMAILLIANIISRSILSESISFAEELGKFGLITVTFISVSYTLRHNTQVEMTAIVSRLPKRAIKPVRIITQILTGIILIVVAYVCMRYVQSVYALNRVTPALRMPIWITLLGLPLGMFLGGVQSLFTAILNIRDKEQLWTGSESIQGQASGLSTYTLPDN